MDDDGDFSAYARDEIPTGPAPIGDLLIAGHAARRRKRNTRVAVPRPPRHSSSAV